MIITFTKVNYFFSGLHFGIVAILLFNLCTTLFNLLVHNGQKSNLLRLILNQHDLISAPHPAFIKDICPVVAPL